MTGFLDVSVLNIEQDTRRFRRIVRGQVRRNLRKFMSNSELLGRRGKDIVSIPLPEIELPHFRFGDGGSGVGQGEGELGQAIGRGQPREGGDQAGDQPGAHILEVELSLAELAEILGEELELPRIQPKSHRHVEGDVTRFTGMRRVGPESLRYFKRTYREALKRQLSSGTYDPDNPVIVPIRDDKRYRSWKIVPRPDNNAVVIYMMDVSGSMTQRKKELVRLTAFWIDTWLRVHYKNIETRYIVHDAAAHEVDVHTFYHLRESGGTRISSAYELCHNMIRRDFDPQDWNVYGFHFSDGENFGAQDDRRCIEILETALLPAMNLFCYGQVYGMSGRQFIDALADVPDDKLTTARIEGDADIYAAIKSFLGKGY